MEEVERSAAFCEKHDEASSSRTSALKQEEEGSRPQDFGIPDLSGLTLKDLPHRQAILALDLERTMHRFLPDISARQEGNVPDDEDGAHTSPGLLLALSGGADSTALAILMKVLAPRLGVRLHVLTCDHGLRENAAADCAFTLALARSLDLPAQKVQLHVRERSSEEGEGLEEAGRTLRYLALERIRQEERLACILTAHHAGDLAEDILMRLVRGTGWPALGGMRMYDADRRLLRPLLHVEGRELRELLQSIGCPHREDETNADISFLRNRVRHTILPLFLQENPAFLRNLVTLSRQADLDASFLNQELDRALQAERKPNEASLKSQGAAAGGIDGDVREVQLSSQLMEGLAPALRPRMILRAIRTVCAHHGGQARGTTVLACEEARTQGRGGRTFQMPGGVSVTVKGHGLVIRAGKG